MIDDKLLEIIKNRRSIRQFDLSKKVELEKINQLLEAANWAPSACNAQAWHFVVINDKFMINDLIEKGFSKAKNTPVLIFVFYRTYVKGKPINHDFDDDIQSASASIQNMLLMAHNLGLGATWINGINIDIKKVIEIPYGYKFIAMVKLGYPKHNESKEQIRKYSVSQFMTLNKFNLPKNDLENKKSIYLEKFIYTIKRIKLINLLIKLIPISVKKRIIGYKDIESFKKN